MFGYNFRHCGWKGWLVAALGACVFFLLAAQLGTADEIIQSNTLNKGEGLGDKPKIIEAPGKSHEIMVAAQQNALAAYHYYLLGDYAEAYRSALSAAQENDPYAQALLGLLYLDGIIVAHDGALSALWFGRSAKQGNPQAALHYGLMLYSGQYVPRDQRQGEEFLRYSIVHGVPEAYFYYGQLLLKSYPNGRLQPCTPTEDGALPYSAQDAALGCFLEGAQSGVPDALVAAAQLLAEGTDHYDKDEPRAREFLEQASVQGFLNAQLILADWLLSGRGGPKDQERAEYLLRSLAAQNITDAQIALAYLYYEGGLGAINFLESAVWYSLAKESGARIDIFEDLLDQLTPAQQQEVVKKCSLLRPKL